MRRLKGLDQGRKYREKKDIWGGGEEKALTHPCSRWLLEPREPELQGQVLGEARSPSVTPEGVVLSPPLQGERSCGWMLTYSGGLKMIAKGKREQQFRGPQVTGRKDSPVALASREEPLLAPRPRSGLTPRGKAPEPARWATAAPPNLRGRGSQARSASSEAAGRAAGPGQAGHAGPTGSRDSQQRKEGQSDAGRVYGAAAARAARGSIAAAPGSLPVTSRLRPSQFRLPTVDAH